MSQVSQTVTVETITITRPLKVSGFRIGLLLIAINLALNIMNTYSHKQKCYIEFDHSV